MDIKNKGLVYAMASAICYGTNPLGALMLYADGLDTSSVVALRFSLSSVILLMMLTITHRGFFLTLKEAFIITVLGVLFAASASSLYLSFRYMDAGVASTLLFTYPIMVAAMMAIFFKEKLKFSTYMSILFAFTGVALLSLGNNGDSSWDWTGAALVLLSSLTYAVYMIIVNKTSIRMSSIKLNFYVLTVCALCVLGFIYATGNQLMLPSTPHAFFFMIWLAVVPSVMSMVFLSMAVRSIGSTATATLGALEPLTAVVIGVAIFGEAFTLQLGFGISLTLISVIILTLGDQLTAHKVTHIINDFGEKLKKHWRWRV